MTFSNRDIVVISPQYWGDLWVSKHWIAHELASRGNRVLFVEPPVWLGGCVRRPWANRRHWTRLACPTRRINERLWAFRPYHPLFDPSHKTVAAQVTRQVERRKFHDTILLNFDTNYHMIGACRESISVYYCVDPVFPQPGHEEDEAQTCRRSDLIYAVSDRYERHLGTLGGSAPIHVIPHGFAVEHARKTGEAWRGTRPPEFKHLKQCILGYVGSIHDSYVDVGLLEELSAARPNYDFVLIGPYRNNPLGPDLSVSSLRRLRSLSNVHLLGPRPFLDVPKYACHFAAGLVLVDVRTQRERYQTDRRTHFKWLAYFSLGLPVVAPNLIEASEIGGLIYAASDVDEYIRQLDRAVQEPIDSPSRQARYHYATQFSFERMLDRIADPIRALEDRQTGLTEVV